VDFFINLVQEAGRTLSGIFALIAIFSLGYLLTTLAVIGLTFCATFGLMFAFVLLTIII